MSCAGPTVERICGYLIVLVAGRVRIAGDIDELRAGHRLVTGPLDWPQRAGITAITATNVGGRTTALVRLDFGARFGPRSKPANSSSAPDSSPGPNRSRAAAGTPPRPASWPSVWRSPELSPAPPTTRPRGTPDSAWGIGGGHYHPANQYWTLQLSYVAMLIALAALLLAIGWRATRLRSTV